MSLRVLGTNVIGAIRSIMTNEVKAQIGETCEPAKGRYTIAVPKPENPLTRPDIKAPNATINNLKREISGMTSPRKDSKKMI